MYKILITAIFTCLSSLAEQAHSTQRDLELNCPHLLSPEKTELKYRQALSLAIELVDSQKSTNKLKAKITKHIIPFMQSFRNRASLEEFARESGWVSRTSYEAYKKTAQELLETLTKLSLPFEISTKSKTFLKRQKKARTEKEMLLYDLSYALYDIIGWYAGSLVIDQ